MNRVVRGQALVEFTLVLPVFLAVTLLFLQLCVLGVRWWQLNSVTGTVVRQAAAANGETRAVDDAVQSITSANGLRSDDLWVEVDTNTGAGRLHRADQAQSSDAPPSADYGGTVTVHLTYRTPLIFGLFGNTVSLQSSFSQASSSTYGGLGP